MRYLIELGYLLFIQFPANWSIKFKNLAIWTTEQSSAVHVVRIIRNFNIVMLKLTYESRD